MSIWDKRDALKVLLEVTKLTEQSQIPFFLKKKKVIPYQQLHTYIFNVRKSVLESDPQVLERHPEPTDQKVYSRLWP